MQHSPDPDPNPNPKSKISKPSQKQRHIYFITGASKGLGRAISCALSNQKATYTTLVLTARDETGLVETVVEITKICGFEKQFAVNMNSSETGILHVALSKDANESCPTQKIVDVYIVFGDLSYSSGHKEIVDKIFYPLKSKSSLEYDVCGFVHNAASLGTLRYISNFDSSTKQLKQYMWLNLGSVMVLTSEFLRLTTHIKTRFIVNISSLAAQVPFPSWSQYCSLKAARDMYFQVLATEPNNPPIRCLNYAPGMLDTDMQKFLRSNNPRIDHKPHTQFFTQVHQENKLHKPIDAANFLVELLQKNTFTNGAHIDYTFSLENSENSENPTESSSESSSESKSTLKTKSTLKSSSDQV